LNTFLRVKNTVFTEIPFEKLEAITNRYCLSDNKQNCERYKLFEEGKEITEGLIADGRKIHFIDLLLKSMPHIDA